MIMETFVSQNKSEFTLETIKTLNLNLTPRYEHRESINEKEYLVAHTVETMEN